MFSLPVLVSLVALGVAGWAAWWAIVSALVARRAQDELRAGRLELVKWQQRAADEQAGKERALQLLDEQAQLRADDLRAMSARLDAAQHKYNTLLQLYKESIVIDGPLASKRLQ